ncbi:MAG: DegT/DnrJ/EryC1/StrS family aminotransferase [Candidatus Aminicenantaceae bacterium]
MDIPFLDLKAQYQSIKQEIDKKFLEVASSQRFILGPEVEGLEKDIAAYSGVKFAVGVSSGSDALMVSLMALEIGEGDEVITTPFTFFATAGAIARLKAKPVFCDIEESGFNISPAGLEELLKIQIEERGNSRIKAIIPVHLYGQCADMSPILELAKKYNLLVIEDAAQAIGADYPLDGSIEKAGTMGNLGTISFFPSKNLGGFGDGGMVLMNDEELSIKIRRLRVHGSRDKYVYEMLGGNFRLDELQAAILRVKFKYLDGWHRSRIDKAVYYDRKFKKMGLDEKNLVKIPETLYKNSGAEHFHTYHQYVIRAKKRDKLKEFLKERKVATAIYYPLPLHLQKCFSYLGYKEGDFPESERASREVLALPIYPELTREQQDYIIYSIYDFYNK